VAKTIIKFVLSCRYVLTVVVVLQFMTTELSATTTCRCCVSSEHSSGCADGKTDGLADYEEVQACSGRWQGHVKRARTLCAAGWQVCSPRHSSALTLLTWNDVTRLPGCYAYNAANTLNLCSVYVAYSHQSRSHSQQEARLLQISRRRSVSLEICISYSRKSRSLKVIRNYTAKYGMCKFLLVFRCNYVCILYRFRDNQRRIMANS